MFLEKEKFLKINLNESARSVRRIQACFRAPHFPREPFRSLVRHPDVSEQRGSAALVPSGRVRRPPLVPLPVVLAGHVLGLRQHRQRDLH